MSRARLAAVALVVASLGVAAYLVATHRHGRARAPAPGFALVDLDGAPLTLDALRGKVVLIDFWATWCGPCRDEIPHLIDLQARYAARGVQLVGISMDDDVAPVRRFAAELHMNYPVAVGDAAIGQRYGGVLGLPAKFLIDRQGRIASKHVGPVDPAILGGELDALLAE